MTRRQMLGLAERATRYAVDPLAQTATSTATKTSPTGTAGEQPDLTHVVPKSPTREGPAHANGHVTGSR